MTLKMKKQVKPKIENEPPMWFRIAMGACNMADKEFVPVKKRMTPEKLKELKKIAGGD